MLNNININRVLENDTYDKVRDDLYTNITEDFSNRHKQVDFIVNGKKFTLTAGEALMNLVLFQMYQGMPEDRMDGILIEGKKFSANSLSAFMDTYIERFSSIPENRDKHEIAQEHVANALNELSKISVVFNIKAGNTLCLADFISAIANDEEAKELFCPVIDTENIAFKDIETKFTDYTNRIYDYFKRHDEHCLSVYAKSDTGLNKKQLTQSVGFVGLKPDMEGHVIPVVINENFLNGINSPEHYMVTAKSARKALATNFKFVRISGYLTRKLSLACADIAHDDTVQDCLTDHYIYYNIESLDKIKRIEGRHYYLLDQDGRPMSALLTMDYEKQKDMLANVKVIGLRSPVTCAGSHTCRTCYGSQLSALNKDLNTGIIAVLYLTNTLTQKLLSSKHLLSVTTDNIEWGESFSKYFSVNLDEILLNDDTVSLLVNKDDAVEDENDNSLYTNKVYIKINKKTTVLYESPVELFLNLDLFTQDTSGNYTLSGSDNISDDPVFYVDIRNNELIASLVKVIDLLENEKHLGVHTIDELVNTFVDLIIENDLPIMAIHAEMILSVMIRNSNDHSLKAEFDKIDRPDYEIDRISKVLFNMPLGVSLSFERIEEQLKRLETYHKRKPSIIDNLYK